MSEYFLRKYRPVADALLEAHGLIVPDATRDMLAEAISHYRELPKPKPDPRGSRSPRPALRTARTHALKLIEYANRPPTCKASVPLRCARLASAIRSNEMLVGLNLAVADPPVDPNVLLDQLDAGHFDVDVLRQLVLVANAVEGACIGVGRPWAAHTPIIRGGCIAWHRAGRDLGYRWRDDTGTLTGPLPAFLRELIAYCDKAALCLFQEKPRRAPAGCDKPAPALATQGDCMCRRTSDSAIRDGIRAWKAWCAGLPVKSGTFSS